MLNAALAYAARGWRVHPLKPRDKTPISQNGCKDATTDKNQICKWWSKFPDANIGLATGYEFFALDIDPDGMAWCEANDLPATHEAVTGRGGRHLLYRIPSGAVIKNSSGKIAPGVDIRGIGGYICAAPSLHPNGTPYAWLDCEGDAPEGPCADAPLWLVDMAVKTGEADNGRFNLPSQIVEGGRDNALYKFAASMRGHSFGPDEIRVALTAANTRCVPPLTDADLDRITRSVCTKPPGKSPQYQQRQISTPAPVEAVVHEAEFVEEAEIETHSKLTPNALADRIMTKHHIINADGYLYEYTGRFWELISPERLKALAAAFDGKFNTSQKRRSEISDYIRTQTHVKNQKWRDLEPYEVPVGNGVVDIRSMTLRPHRKTDMIQACCPVEFDPRAECPELMMCLGTYFGADADGDAKVSALQEFFGYCLMPHARYKKALLCVGESDCGKSTIPFLIRELVGRMNVCSVSVEDMDDSRARAPLLGKLVNLLTELTSDAMIADGGFKTLVSTEEPIQFDPKYLPPVMDIPVCKHVIVTNTLPTINDRSRGTYNRLLIVRFNHVIPRSEQDRGIWDKLAEELPGILQWALEGAQRLFHAGGSFTAAGEAEVEEYRERQDPVAAFVLDECEVDEEFRVALPDLRQRYSQWFGKPVDPRRFADLIRSSGYAITQNPIWFGGKKHRAVIGLALR